MLENRSLDHMLGWSGLRGVDARTGEPTALEGLTGAEANDVPSGRTIPVKPGADFVLPIDPGHDFDDVLEQLCGRGATFPGGEGSYPPITNSGYASRLANLITLKRLDVDPAVVMRGFRPGQLPVLQTLASEFAVCDRWFSSMPGPTWPNRFFVHAATSGGLDDSPTAARSATAMLRGYQFEHGTLFDRLDAAGLDWSVVEGDALPQSLGMSGMVERAVAGRFITMEQLARKLTDPAFADAYVFIEPHYGHVLVDGRNFKCGNSQHPLDDVTRGERLIKNVYEMVRTSPHWERSLLVLLYDEHGGFYDHVVPPACVAPGDAFLGDTNRHGFAFDRLGPRVPAIVISPYTPRGLIDHTTRDHASILATVEGLCGLTPLTERDAQAARLQDLFGLPAPRADTPVSLPEPAVSGVPDCEDSVTHRLAGELEQAPAELSGEVDSALAGFLQVAIARELHLAAAAHRDVERALDQERDRLLTAFHSVGTKFDAASACAVSNGVTGSTGGTVGSVPVAWRPFR